MEINKKKKVKKENDTESKKVRKKFEKNTKSIEQNKEEINIKKKSEKIFKISLYILLLIVITLYFFSYIIAITAVTVFSRNIFIILITTSIYLVLISATYIIYKYILTMIKNIKEKKKAPSIIMLGITIIAIIIAVVIKLQKRMSTIGITMSTIYLLGIIIIPLVMIGFAILGKSKNKSVQITKIVVSILLTIFIYTVNIPILITLSQNIINRISINMESIDATEKSDLEKGKINIDYLENYRQKMENKGYIDKYDVNNIIDIASKRTDDIIINYKNGQEESIEVTNKDQDNWKEKIQNSLEGDYYKFSYTYENNQSKIYIEKYIVNSETDEKNIEDINGTERADLIEKKYINFENPEANNYTFENSIIMENKQKNSHIENMKIMFIFDEELQNYIPVVENEQELSKIKEYKIYSTGLQVTLEDNVQIDKKDYTIRLNKYDENLKANEEKGTNYYYEYEPVVTELKNSNGNIVLEFKFDNIYTVKNLKNIEIIF